MKIIFNLLSKEHKSRLIKELAQQVKESETKRKQEMLEIAAKEYIPMSIKIHRFLSEHDVLLAFLFFLVVATCVSI